MSLVELFRATGDRKHLDLAKRMIDLRGHGLLGTGRFGPAYWQDHAPVRDAPTVAGHAVRQLYLDCGAVDVAVELGDQALLDAVLRRWRDMVATRSYLTGGVGSRHSDEAFGDPFELPPDRAYAETCAAIASVMLAWRLLLATGEPDCADVIERTMLNGFLSGVSVEGSEFFYVNPLQRRTNGAAVSAGDGGRKPWYRVRLLPTERDADAELVAAVPRHRRRGRDPAPPVRLGNVPSGRGRWHGPDWRWTPSTHGAARSTVTVQETPGRPWALSMRIPAWTRSATLRIGAGEPTPGARRGADDRRDP